jgi:uncharacterized protein (TIGR03000 family)
VRNLAANELTAPAESFFSRTRLSPPFSAGDLRLHFFGRELEKCNEISRVSQTGYAEEADMPAMQQNIAHVRVLVPAGAKISFNGMDTDQTGTERVFATPELEPGRSYKYEVRAHWMVGDKETTQTRQVTFHAGDGVTVNFM